MTFEIKQKPKKIYESVTYEFTLVDDNGKEYELRKWEDTNGGGYYIHGEEGWKDYFPDDDLLDFIDYDLDFTYGY